MSRGDGAKELIAMADGYRESAESWADLLRDVARSSDEGLGTLNELAAFEAGSGAD